MLQGLPYLINCSLSNTAKKPLSEQINNLLVLSINDNYSFVICRDHTQHFKGVKPYITHHRYQVTVERSLSEADRPKVFVNKAFPSKPESYRKWKCCSVFGIGSELVWAVNRISATVL